MPICKFFLENRCTRGSSCSFEHTRPGVKQGAVSTEKYNEQSLKLGLKDERPTWQLSVFGPAKEEPNLIVGTDRSPEEDRVLYYQSMRTTGNTNQFIANHDEAVKAMETQVNAILNDPKGALKHYETQKANNAGGFGKPAGTSFAPFLGSGGGAFGGGGFGQSGGGAFGQSSSGAFGQPAAGGAFGQPAAGGAFGQPAAGGGAFGQPAGGGAFGQPAGGGAFGQPAGGGAFGQPAAGGAFGQPAGGAFGQKPASGSAFGTTSTLGSGSAFGSTSALGGGAFGQKPAVGASAFGTTSTLGSGSAFGSTSALGSGSAFGTTSTLGGGGGAFGQKPAAGASAFGTPSTLGGGSTFGSTSALGAGSTFGSTSALGGGTFGQKPAVVGSAFGATSTLGATQQTPAFGQTTPVATNNAFKPATPFGALPPQPSTTTPVSAGAPATENTLSSDDPNMIAFKAPAFELGKIPEIPPPVGCR
ncbi:hypothetical protein CLU79DRAFT_848056 [Phycomyces nitens]|nr:hypothetical protein CLU79DRAFT_848056 [Phycomyces nitens]